HTPFGHAGERMLNQLRKNGFRHNIQSVRVVDHIENYGKGLNLTYEVKNGIACHSDNMVSAKTLEGKIVRISDKIAYINHDIEDAIRAGVLNQNDLPYDSIYVLGRTKSERITTCILSIVNNSTDDIVMDESVLKAHLGLKAFMFENVYTSPVAKSEEIKAQGIVENLYHYYNKNPQKLPDFYGELIKKFGVERVVCDYIAGMSDQFAVDLYKEMYIPHFWKNTKN
ncbi:MAG: deoxyguanosinetriphosphate triphosphohydrolase, partial [Oscillospiraceae bacterium]